MTDQQFDEFFKSRLSAHASPVREEVWEKIIAEKERKRRGIIWLPLAAALLLLFCGGYFLVTNTTKKQPVTANKNLQATIKEPKPKQQQKTTTLSEPVYNNAAKKTKTQSEKNTVTSKEPDKIFYSQHKAVKQTLSAGNNTEPAKAILNSAQANETIKQKEVATAQTNPEHYKETFSNQMAASSADSVKQANNVVAAIDSANVLTKNIIKPFKNKIKKWFIEIYGAPEYAFQSLTVNNEKANSATFDNSKSLVDLKKQSEAFVTSFTAGIRVSRRINQHLYVKTGVEYRQINAKFHYPYSLNSSLGIPQSYYNNFDSYSISGANSNLNLYAQPYQNKQTYTLYKSLSIPVLLSYEKTGRKFSIAATAGPVFTINRSYSGYTINSSNLQRELASADAPYKKNTGTSLYAGPQFYKTC